MRYIVEFDAPSELSDSASDGVYDAALVSVLGNIGNLRVVRNGAFIGYIRAKDQSITWMEVSRES